MTGTARYASVNTHLGIEQSRRDDLEAIAYVLVYFAKGSLPWQGLKADDKKKKYEMISAKKMATTVEELCSGLPVEFARFLTYCKSLHFEDKPDYAYLRKLLKTLFLREGYKYDDVYDWTTTTTATATATATTAVATAQGTSASIPIPTPDRSSGPSGTAGPSSSTPGSSNPASRLLSRLMHHHYP